MRLLRGLGALLLLALLLVGLPAGLATFGSLDGLPAPSDLWGALTRPDDGTLLVSILTIIGWVAWATFVLSVLVEIPAQIRSVPAPRLPAGLGVPQAGARVLVAAVIGMLTVGGAVSPAMAGEQTVEAGDTLSGIAAEHLGEAAQWPQIADANPDIADPDLIYPGQELTIPEPEPDEVEESAEEVGEREKTVTVERGDTLSGIAAEHLGEAAQWPQIADANPDIADPDLIYPGQEFTIPGTADAAPAETTAEPAVAEEPAPEAEAGPTEGQETEQTPVVQGTGSAAIEEAPPSTETAAEPAAATTFGEGSAQVEESDSALRTAAGIGACSAAGVLLLLAGRRAVQSRRRGPGRRIAMPTGAAAAVETQLRETSDPLAVTHLDQALRTIASWAHQSQTPMPPVRGALITPDEIEIYLADETSELPAPFTSTGEQDGTWSLSRDGASKLLTPQEAQDIPAPCPSMVTLGHDSDGGWVLINLEEIGALGVAGDPQSSQGVLAALTLELIGSAWADDVRVTLVGVLPELAQALGSDRVEHVPTLDRVLPGMTYASDVHARTLAASEQDSVTTARGAMVATETWTPHLLVLASDPTEAERATLTEILQTNPRLAVATITTGTTPLTDWVLQHTSAGARLDPPGIELTPQVIAGADYDALIDAFTTTDAEDTPGPEWTRTLTGEVALADLPTPALQSADEELGQEEQVDEEVEDQQEEEQEQQREQDDDVDEVGEVLVQHIADEDHEDPAAVSAAQVEDDQEAQEPAAQAAQDDLESPGGVIHPMKRPGPLVRLLGAVEVQRAEGKRPQSPGRVTELIAYLALHPSETHEPMDAAMWPGQRVDAKRRNPILSQARKWLGTAADDRPHVAFVDDGGYRLHEDVMTDWHELTRIIGDDISAVSTEDLTTALRLVDGQPLSGVAPQYYAWAEVDRMEMIATIADIAHEVASRSLSAGDPRTAAWAAAKGTAVEPASELLWRDQLRAAWLSAIPGRVHDIAQQMTTTLEPIGSDMEPETIELLEQLLTDTAPARAHA